MCCPSICECKSILGRGVCRAEEPHKQGEIQKIRLKSLQRALINPLPDSYVISSSFLWPVGAYRGNEKSESWLSCLCLALAGGSICKRRSQVSIRPERGFAEGPYWKAPAAVSWVLHRSDGPDQTAEGPREQMEFWAAGAAGAPQPQKTEAGRLEDSSAQWRSAGQSTNECNIVRNYTCI